MNRYQKLVVLVGVVLVTFIGLFPPWRFEMMLFPDAPHLIKRSAGYAPVFSPPPQPNQLASVRLDCSVLAVEWLTVILACSGLAVLLRNHQRN